MEKLLVQVAGRQHVGVALGGRLVEEAASLAGRHQVAAASVWLRAEDDPLGSRGPLWATVELRPASGLCDLAFTSLIEDLHERVAGVAHADLSSCLVGEEHQLVPAAPTPFRYQYLMRRRYDFDHESYLRRYLEVHAEFGRRTPGHRGYVQLHVDPARSRETARLAGFGGWQIDSVSELHIEDLDAFVREVGQSPVTKEARQDERAFLDRAASTGFTSRLRWRSA